MTEPQSAPPNESNEPEAHSHEAFHRAVHDVTREVAVFDCDGTLWSCDAGSGFMRYTMQHGLLPPDRVAHMNERYRGHQAREVSELDICGEMTQIYAGLPEEALRRAAADFIRDEVHPFIFPELEKLIADLSARGVEIWAVSSTNDWAIEEGVRRFGIAPERVLATRVQVVDGKATEVLLDVPTDEGKAHALARVGITSPCAVFGNSIHDAAMLRLARRAFPVNPSAELEAHSAATGWKVYYPGAIRP